MRFTTFHRPSGAIPTEGTLRLRRTTSGEALARLWRRRLLSTAAAIGLGAALVAPASGETLTDALIQAYSTNPQIRAARANLRATDEEVPQALSNWRPTVTVTGSAGVVRSDNEPSNLSFQNSAVDTFVPRSLGIAVSQPVFRGFRTVAETRRARNDIAATRANLLATEQQVLLDAITAYTAVVRELAVVDLNRNNERVLQRQLDATQDRFNVGELTLTDVAQAEARLTRATADRIGAEGDLVSANATYARVVGLSPGSLDPAPEPSDLPASLDEALALTHENNPSVVAADYRERAARDAVSVVEGELLPTLTLDGNVVRSVERSFSGSTSIIAQVLANVTVPLYQSGSVFSRVRQGKHIAAQRLADFDDARREAVRATTAAWEALQTSRAQIRSFEKEVDSQEIALEGVQAEARVGSRTVLDELDAEQELLNARVNLVRAQRDATVAAYQLLSAVGRLTAESIGLPVEIYDLNANLARVENKFFGGDIAGD